MNAEPPPARFQMEDQLRRPGDGQFVGFLKQAAQKGLPIFTICHGAQILISAGLVKGRKIAGSPDIRTDLRNAGAEIVEHQSVVVDKAFPPLVSSRDPNDLAPFCRAIAEHFQSASTTRNAP